MSESKSFRVAIVGESPEGDFLLERLSLLPGCEADVFPPEKTSASALDWDAVLFLDGLSASADRVAEVQDAGSAVGLLPPLAWSASQWRKLVSEPGRRWFLLSPQNEDLDFRSALASVESGRLGPIETVKRVSWVGELVAPEGSRNIPDHWLAQWLWEDLDQLLQLVGEPPASVYAADFREQPAGYLLIFRFANGVVAHLERRRGSAVPLELGWTITGPEGGYANGQRHIKTEAGELYSVPVELPGTEAVSAADPWQMLHAVPGDQARARHVENILNLRKAITESAHTESLVRI